VCFHAQSQVLFGCAAVAEYHRYLLREISFALGLVQEQLPRLLKFPKAAYFETLTRKVST
jgi:hypothetical protein